MAWTSPRTWSAGETVTAALMNAHVRDNINAIAPRMIRFLIGRADGGVVAVGYHDRLWFSAPCKVTGWTILADAVGSVVVDIQKLAYGAGGSPASIAGSEKPTLSSAAKAQDLTLTTWTQNIAADDVLYAYVESATTVKQVTVCLRMEPL